MKRSLIVNLLLALFVGGLALWITLRPGDKEAPGETLSVLKRDEVKKIRILRGGLPEFVLEREGKLWVQTQPFRARTDHAQTGRLLDLLAATAKDKLEAKDLARFELDQPFARVFVDAQEFAFGMLNPMTNQQYVLSNNAVYLVSPVFGYGLPTKSEGLASHMLLAEDEVPVRFELPGVVLESKDGKWQVVPAPDKPPSQDDLVRWAESWRFASSLETRSRATDAKGEPVRIVTKAGKTLPLVVVSRSPNLVLARSDEKLEFLFPADMVTRLFDVPKAAEPPPAK